MATDLRRGKVSASSRTRGVVHGGARPVPAVEPGGATLPQRPRSTGRLPQVERLLPAPPKTSPLTWRQTEVLLLTADGLTAEEAGARLWVSPWTIRAHRKQIMMRLDARNPVHAVATGLRMGLIE